MIRFIYYLLFPSRRPSIAKLTAEQRVKWMALNVHHGTDGPQE